MALREIRDKTGEAKSREEAIELDGGGFERLNGG
jgi:hypothetical protein